MHRLALCLTLASLLAVPGAAADDDAASCAPGGDLPVVWWDVRIYSGTCVGVEVERHPDAPFACRDERLPPCYASVVVP